MRERLMQMAQESTLTQGLVTALLVGTMCYLWIEGRVVPSELYLLGGTVCGFWFGNKSTQQTKKLLGDMVWQSNTASQAQNPGPTSTN